MGQEQMRLRRFSFGVRNGDAPDLRRWIDFATLMLPKSYECLTGGNDRPPSARRRQATVTAREGGKSCVAAARYSLANACRLQGLPDGFLSDSPFTAAGKLKAVANGVPLPLGRAIAGAIKQWRDERTNG